MLKFIKSYFYTGKHRQPEVAMEREFWMRWR